MRSMTWQNFTVRRFPVTGFARCRASLDGPSMATRGAIRESRQSTSAGPASLGAQS